MRLCRRLFFIITPRLDIICVTLQENFKSVNINVCIQKYYENVTVRPSSCAVDLFHYYVDIPIHRIVAGKGFFFQLTICLVPTNLNFSPFRKVPLLRSDTCAYTHILQCVYVEGVVKKFISKCHLYDVKFAGFTIPEDEHIFC